MPRIYVAIQVYESLKMKAQKENVSISDVVSRLVPSVHSNGK